MATQTMTDTAMTDVPQVATASSTSKSERPPIAVTKPIPYTTHLAHLLATDPNPLPSTTTLLSNHTTLNTTLKTLARDGAQTLINALLTTCPIQSTPDGLSLTLPPSTNRLPRWKPLPKPKTPTKWENFARKKGIGKFGGNSHGGAVRDERRKNMVYDEESGEWVRKWGYKGKSQRESGEWLVELDEKKQGKEEGLEGGKGIRAKGKRENMEKMRRVERKVRNNERKGKRGGKVG